HRDQGGRDAAQPDQQGDDDRQRQADEDDRAAGRAGVEQAETDAVVPHRHEVEERQHLDRPRTADDEQVVEEELGRLVEDQGDGGDGKAKLHSAALRKCSTASLQRTQSDGWVLSLPTSGRTRQQRSHFSPSAARKATATPGTSGSAKCSGSCLPKGCRWRPQVMQISSRSRPARAASYFGSVKSTGPACRLEPIFLSARASSSAPV